MQELAVQVCDKGRIAICGEAKQKILVNLIKRLPISLPPGKKHNMQKRVMNFYNRERSA
jgi:hypothetical protein